MSRQGPILRVFEVKTKSGCGDTLLSKFETTSSKVVRNEPGNRGYFFGRCIQGDNNVVLFVSIWEDLDAVKSRFGKDWQESYLPDGYADLIETCTIRHFDMGSGWQIDPL